MFVSFVDNLSVWHLRLLLWFTDPSAWYRKNNVKPREIHLIGNLPQVISEAFPELRPEPDLAEQCVSDLQSRGLLAKFSYHTNMSGQGIYSERGTKLGRQFLAFITAPHN